MKISPALYNMLKNDCEAVCSAYDLDTASIKSRADAWNIFRGVCFHRNSDDTHPSFQNGNRILPFDQEASDNPKINGAPYLGRFYELEDLNDNHIKTALKRIMPNAGL